VRLSLSGEDRGHDEESKFTAVNGTIYLKPDIVPKGADPEKYLLWYFRHQLSHVHHCPYDIRTAYNLQRAAYEQVRDWGIAYLATQIFSDIQVDLYYLPRRFGELPYHTRIIGKGPSTLAEEIMNSIYLCVNPAVKIPDETLAKTAREILLISSLDRPWQTKVQMIASVLQRLRGRSRAFSKKEIERSIRRNPLNVREDFQRSTIEGFFETYGSITDEKAAKEFYEHWIKPRLPSGEEKRAREALKLKMHRKKGEHGGLKDEKTDMKATKAMGDRQRTGGGYDLAVDLMDEPRLPTSMSKPYKKLRLKNLSEIMWKRYWFKSRAQRAIIHYLAESRRRRPVWSVIRYPDEWYIEDEIEDLDVETSLDEGPIIPEVTTLKWVEEPTPHGQSISSGFVPSTITVLDVSRSMGGVHNEAAVAAFIAHQSAWRSGGRTAVVTFSTGYVSADWEAPEETKELALSMSFDEFTIFPSFEVQRLASENKGPCFIVVITDGGWQNVEEAVPSLKRISESGHSVIIFLIKGGEYHDRVELIKRTPNLRIRNVVNPEADLHGLVLSESMRVYGRFVT